MSALRGLNLPVQILRSSFLALSFLSLVQGSCSNVTRLIGDLSLWRVVLVGGHSLALGLLFCLICFDSVSVTWGILLTALSVDIDWLIGNSRISGCLLVWLVASVIKLSSITMNSAFWSLSFWGSVIWSRNFSFISCVTRWIVVRLVFGSVSGCVSMGFVSKTLISDWSKVQQKSVPSHGVFSSNMLMLKHDGSASCDFSVITSSMVVLVAFVNSWCCLMRSSVTSWESFVSAMWNLILRLSSSVMKPFATHPGNL